MRFLYIFLLYLGIMMGFGCTGSKNFSNKAQKLEKAGLNDEAAQFYYQSLQRNPRNVDASIGLKKTGQKQIERTLTQFYKAYSVGNTKESVYKYQEALDYQRRYGYFVAMEIPPYYEDYYKEMLEKHLEQRYEEASNLLYEEKFGEAKAIYEEIVKLSPQYRNAKDLQLETTIEPLYRQGVQEFESGKYRKCYQTMSNVLSQKKIYKDAFDYKERALENGRITVAILGFETAVNGKANVAKSIQSDVVSVLTQRNDPFMLIVDRANTEDLIREQQLSVKNKEMGNSSLKTGELVDANILVKGTLISYTSTGGTVKSYERQGFESYKVKKMNADNKPYYQTNYKRVMYYEYEGRSSVFMEVQYQMISAETGEVLRSQIVRNEKSDFVNYVDYPGDYKNLYPGKYSNLAKDDVIFTDYAQKSTLQKKASTTKRTLKSESQLAAETVNSITKNITQGIESYDADEL